MAMMETNTPEQMELEKKVRDYFSFRPYDIEVRGIKMYSKAMPKVISIVYKFLPSSDVWGYTDVLANLFGLVFVNKHTDQHGDTTVAYWHKCLGGNPDG